MNTVDEEPHVKDIQQCSLNTSLRKLLKNSKFHHKAATTFRLLPTTHHIHISTLLQVTSSVTITEQIMPVTPQNITKI